MKTPNGQGWDINNNNQKEWIRAFLVDWSVNLIQQFEGNTLIFQTFDWSECGEFISQKHKPNPA